MNHSTLRKSGLAAGVAAAAALVAVGVPLALAAPTVAPPSDGQGYVDSTARCAKPDTAAIFGSTDSSRVAICQTAGGEYQYRGVRINDGATLIMAATKTSAGSFVVRNDGATYTVTPQALSVTIGGSTVRTETWTDYHGPQSPASTSATATPGTSSTPGLSSTPSTPATAAPKTSAVPLPPPMPAEVGGGTSVIR